MFRCRWHVAFSSNGQYARKQCIWSREKNKSTVEEINQPLKSEEERNEAMRGVERRMGDSS
jgi:tRNA A37 N6-isopentenylltransferase MiaA